jgi:hypothetical protein
MDQPSFSFYSPADLQLDLQLSQAFWRENGDYRGQLFRVDGVRSQVDDLYGEIESEGLVFFPVVEVQLVPNFGELLTQFRVAGGVRHQSQEVVFGFYLEEINRKQCRFHDGDFLRYPGTNGPTFYELAEVTELTQNAVHGGQPFYLSAYGVPVNAASLPPALRHLA